MKKFSLFLLIFFAYIAANAQNNFVSDSTTEYKFAARIVPSDYGVGEYYIVYSTTNQFSVVEKLNFNSFVRQVMGEEQSQANPWNKNLLKQNGIKDYYIIAQLWRLRYAIYPFAIKSQDTLGWTKNFANPFMPNAEQMKILQGFGIKTINDFIYGDNLFMLLKDMESKDWVMNYVNAGSQK